MKPIQKIAVIILFAGILFYVSCKKEYSCENCGVNIPGSTNKPPIAIAGPDQVITLPIDSVILNGSSSSDPDGTISIYLWTKISGPATFNINRPADSITKVKSLTVGAYLFELKVTDNSGLSSKDTMRVIVNDPLQPNRPPVAKAGANQSITLPITSVNLDGSASTDPDNNITGYAWTKISGPSSFSIANTSAIQTQTTNLVQGTYLFELKVTDAGGLSAKDTIQVTVNPVINNNCVLSQTLIGSLSIQRSSVNILEAGNKIVFAGGFVGSSGPPMYGASSRVDIYDRANQTWSTAELSLTRFHMGTTTLGNKIYFAGGDNGHPCSRVDIYDASNNTWSTAELSEPREAVIAAAAGNKVLFAGGITSTSTGGTNRVDIYDQSNGSWSTATLSHPTSGSYPGYYVFAESGVVSAGIKIYFMTGSNNIDIYDVQTNVWSTHIVTPNQLTQARVVLLDNKIYFSGSLQGSPIHEYANTLEKYDIPAGNWSSVNMYQSRANMAAIAGDGKIFWAGGYDSSWDANGEQAIRSLKNIEIYDVNTGLHSFHDLQQPEWSVKTLKTNNKIFFSYGHTEIYDMNNHSWTTCNISLDQALAIGNMVYQVGADGINVWKLEF